MAVGQRQRLYSGVRMFTGNYLSSTPRALRLSGAYLERRPLIYFLLLLQITGTPPPFFRPLHHVFTYSSQQGTPAAEGCMRCIIQDILYPATTGIIPGARAKLRAHIPYFFRSENASHRPHSSAKYKYGTRTRDLGGTVKQIYTL
jgi:hypothetical protein